MATVNWTKNVSFMQNYIASAEVSVGHLALFPSHRYQRAAEESNAEKKKAVSIYLFPKQTARY